MKTSFWLIIFIITAIIANCVPEEKGNEAFSTHTPGMVTSETAVDGSVVLDYPSCLNDRETESANVIRVIDGDTVEVILNNETERVRYLMVDTPELTASDPIPGKKASEYNRKLVDGKVIQMVKDTDDRDDFGRLLRFVSVDGVSVNFELVKQGYATTFIRPPNTLCSEEITKAMLEAFKARIGIWHSIPETMNKTNQLCPEGCKQPVTGCEIKGNINSQGDKIYHLPGSNDYPAVEISSQYGERWFCTIEEAIANGWRPPRAE